MIDQDIPEDAARLKLLVADLTRRLQNAHHTVEAERLIAKNATAQAEQYRKRLTEVSSGLRLEAAKNLNLERKKMKELEGNRFEENKRNAAALHDELRLVELDHVMTGFKKEPLKLTRLRTKVEKLEQEQNSQKVLLQQLVELDRINEELSIAAQNGNLEECSSRLRSGASINHVDSAGYLALHYACANGYYNVAKLLLEFGSDYSSYLTGHSPIIIAASNGHNNIVKLLVDFGCSLEDTGSGGCPATLIAFLNSHFDCLDFLLSLGADINSYDNNEDTLLHLAVKSTDERALDIMQFLLQRGINTERINKQNLTPLQLALYNKNKPAIDILGGGRHMLLLDGNCNGGKSVQEADSPKPDNSVMSTPAIEKPGLTLVHRTSTRSAVSPAAEKAGSLHRTSTRSAASPNPNPNYTTTSHRLSVATNRLSNITMKAPPLPLRQQSPKPPQVLHKTIDVPDPSAHVSNHHSESFASYNMLTTADDSLVGRSDVNLPPQYDGGNNNNHNESHNNSSLDLFRNLLPSQHANTTDLLSVASSITYN